MLHLLSVRDLALVDHVQLELEPGLNVLTGETGAGKSILISALALILGGRSSTDAIRSGRQEASVEALFQVEPESELARRLVTRGIEYPDNELLVRRTIGPGRGRVYLNGQLGTVALLQDLLRGVLDITSQHEHVSLLDPDVHVDVLDRFAGAMDLRFRVAELHTQLQASEQERARLEEDEASTSRRLDYLRFSVDEARRLGPQPGEIDELQREREALRNTEKIVAALAGAEARVYGAEGSASEQLGSALRELVGVQDYFAPARASVRELERLVAEVEDLGRSLAQQQPGHDMDGARLEEVDERLDALRRWVRKHGRDETQALTAIRRMEQELRVVERADERRAELALQCASARKSLDDAAERLTRLRKKAGKKFVSALSKELNELSMGDAQLAFEYRPHAQPGSRGAESVELMGTMNPGETARPLRRVASGGELSRLLLALKQVQAERGGIQTYVFDEVDTGIGGGVADVLGRKLRRVAQEGQVLCVTHLPQLAAYADVHFVVEKGQERKRTVSTVRRLDPDERIEELARMLGSDSVRSRSLAEELIESARGAQTPGGSTSWASRVSSPRPDR
ncbi:MAG: DNA repair protein RecN [Myxococcota bacterium]